MDLACIYFASKCLIQNSVFKIYEINLYFNLQ